ncbi:MAG: T9SS type A sorting domain-containing protein [Bacteroidales bacterium]
MKTKNQNCPSLRFIINSLLGIASIVVLLIMPFHSVAQVNYVDINPDTTILKGGLYNLDLNNDGLADFQISLSNDSTYQSDIITCLHDSCFVSFHMVESCYMIEALELNDTVAKTNFNYTMKPEHYRLYFWGIDYCLHSGWFGGQTNKYVGLKIVKNGNIYYGWLRIDVASDGSWVKLKDYAYGGSGILAGQIISNINNLKVESQLSIRNSESEITITSKSNLKITNASLLNSIQQNTELQVNGNQVKVVKSHLPTGLYLVRVNTSEGNCTIKILINK